MPNAYDEMKVGAQVEPVRRGETRARVFEAPVFVFAERGERDGARFDDVTDAGIVVRERRKFGRVVPRTARCLEQFLVARDDRLVLPEAFRVVVGRVDEVLGAGTHEMQAGVVERARHHRRPRPVHTGDRDRNAQLPLPQRPGLPQNARVNSRCRICLPIAFGCSNLTGSRARRG